MSPSTTSAADFDALVETSETLIVRFVTSETETGQDQLLASVIPSAVIAHCDVHQEPELAQRFGLVNESALLIFRQRIILHFEKGAHDVDRVAYLMQQISMLDMDKIRENIEKEKAAEALHLRRACPISRAKLMASNPST